MKTFFTEPRNARSTPFDESSSKKRVVLGALHRRGALSLLSAGALAATLGRSHSGLAAMDTPLLATPEQIEAERTLLRLLKDPKLKSLQAKIKAELAATARGQMKDGAARLDEAIAQWTNSLLFAEIGRYRPTPALIWGTDDTSRTWLGHTLGGVGTSGDNPDAIYRTATIDGDGRYEIVGRFDLSSRPAQLVLEVDHGDMTQMPKVDYSKNADLVTTVAMFTDRDLAIAPDGTFRITIGGAADGPNHLATAPGVLTIGVRDMLSDWNQRPSRLTLRRLDNARTGPVDPAEILKHFLADMEGYIGFWAPFPDMWFGGLKPNTVGTPHGRNGGWGFNVGLRYELEPDQAIVVTIGRGDAAYTGFQIIDPWMIAPDARRNQVSLNLSQSAPNADGSFTYVIAPTDPGVANWLDTAGLHQGYGIIRWQATPPGATTAGLLRDFRIIQMSEVAKMPGVARVSPQQRAAQLAARTDSYNSRVR